MGTWFVLLLTPFWRNRQTSLAKQCTRQVVVTAVRVSYLSEGKYGGQETGAFAQFRWS